jgi:enoyl-[acyl-carrier-protein] reductase (NADH)
MRNTSFFGGYRFVKLWALSLLIVGSAAIGATNVYFGIDDQVSPSLNNPHRIPDHMDPKSQALSREIQSIKYEVKEEMAEVEETIHSIAFRDNLGQSHPILDYTTGTSN